MVTPTKPAPPKRAHLREYREILPYLRPHRVALTAIIFISLLATLMDWCSLTSPSS